MSDERIPRLTADERASHSRRAATFPDDQLVYSLTAVEAILGDRLADLENALEQALAEVLELHGAKEDADA